MDKGVGERLVALRQGRGYSQEQIAMRLGVTHQGRIPA
jgi:transcriptional regulator with XRE-family HTH domain